MRRRLVATALAVGVAAFAAAPSSEVVAQPAWSVSIVQVLGGTADVFAGTAAGIAAAIVESRDGRRFVARVQDGRVRLAGIAVHTAARVSSLADPGEVLVSRTVKDLVAGSGIGFAERGSHVLKGVPGEWELFAAT